MAANKPKRQRKLKARPRTKPAEKLQQAASADDEQQQEGPTDYGGLPNRDLKKNLGCG